MKKFILLLVMIATAATAYNQSSRRTASSNANTRTERNNNRSNVYASNNSTNRTVVNRNSRTTNGSRITVNRHANNNSNRKTKGNYNSSHSNHKVYSTNVSRTVYHTYRSPVHVNVVWNANMHHHYVKMYPTHHWNYRYGYRIASIPAYDAAYFIGDVRNVYGKISDVYYARETDEYFLSIGPNYPYQYFTIIVPGHIARNNSHRPERYFMNRYVKVTGLISRFDGKPEILVKRNFQIDVY